MKKIALGYRLIFGYLGIFMILIGITCLIPLLALFAFPGEAADWYCFVIPGVSSILGGFGLFSLIWKRQKAQLGKHQDFVLLVLAWVVSIVISAVPFLIKGNLNFTGAIFETTSAFSTIGLTVFKDADYDLHLFVLYRSVLCFYGGVGLVLIVTSAISDRYGLKLYIAEGHNDKLLPNLSKSARLIMSIYAGITLLGVIMYSIAGMPVFDSIIHSISAVATGGFTAHPEGLMYYYSNPNISFTAIEIISVFLMIMGSINFLLHMFILTGKFKKVFHDCEIRTLGILCAIFIPLFFIAALAANNGEYSGFEVFSHSTFTFISAITTTGFTNFSNFTSIGQGVMMLVVIVNIIGGGMGSTAGGIKQYRLAVATKSFYWSTKERMSSTSYVYPHYIWRCGEQKEITHKDSMEAYGYILLYITLMLLGSALITIVNGSTFGESLFEFSNAISSTGLSNGLTASCNDAARWILIIGMFAGRLEILGIFFAFLRITNDIFGKETI